MENYKSFLTDSEFAERKDQLQNTWELNQNSLKENREKEIALRKEQSKQSGSLCLSEKDLDGEVWKSYNSNKIKGLEVSSYGRVRLNNKIIPQKDSEANPVGYLVLDNSENPELPKCLVYKMVAKTFLKEPPSEGYEIHHITNNGYDNSVGNLIYLTDEQHKIVEHRSSTTN